MTTILSGQEMAHKIASQIPGSVMESSAQSVLLNCEYLLPVMDYLKNGPEIAFDYLTDLTAVDFLDYFEVVYRLTSLEHNCSLLVKVHCYDREKPELPSVTGLWKGANFMEREIFDLFGIRFNGHPNLSRIFLWEGFNGHPLRKDFTGGKE